jgi:fructose-1,6-bisphosphatase/inositol monophosphatase family enzyme
MDLDLRRRVAEEAARAAGAVHLRHRGAALDRDVHQDNRADYTTVADLESQEAVKQTIERYFPGETVVGEEDMQLRTRIGDVLEGGCWLTDPLDGTQEFAHGNPAFSCVVGYVKDGRPLAGAAYFAALGELFSAAEGRGATLNGAPIHVSGVTDLQQALFAAPQSNFSTPERREQFTRRMSLLLPHVEGFRMPGARSYMVCGVAVGRYDVTAELSPRREPPADRPYRGQPWETAGLAVIAREAGAAITRLGGGPLDLLEHNAYAACQSLLDQYFAILPD